MTLLQQLKDASLVARKAKSTDASFYITLVGEASRPGKDKGNRESTDDEVISVIKKFKAGAEEMLKCYVSLNDFLGIVNVGHELEILESYLPKQMAKEQLEEVIAKFINEASNVNMGQVMAHLKQSYPNQYNGAEASSIAKECLKTVN